MHDEAELLRRYAEKGDEAAFTEFVAQTVNLIHGAALRRTGDPHRAAEVSQQVFISAARNARALARHPRLTGWLYAATRNAALNLMRDEQRQRQREQDAQEAIHLLHASTERVAEPSTMEWAALRPVLDAAMDELSEGDREALLLRFFEGRALAAVGERLRVKENAARMRVERALERLRGSLARRGVASTGAALATALGGYAAPAAPAGLAATLAPAALAAGSAAAVAPGFVVFHFMSQTKILGTAAALAVLALGTATWQVTERQAAEAAMADSRESLAVTMAELKKLEAQAQVVAQPVPAAASSGPASAGSLSTAGPDPSSATPSAASTAKPEPRTAVRLADAMMARHPEVKQAILDWHIKTVNFEYGPLYDELKLTPAQIARFGELQRGDGLFGDWGANGAFLQFQLPKDVSEGHEDDALRELLGPEGFRKYQDFSSTASAREMVARMASRAWMLDVPLTSQQAQVLIANLARIPQPAEDGLNVEYWRKVVAKAGELALSPEQLDILGAIAASEMRSAGMIELWKSEARKTEAAR